jgi:ribosomal protein S12 methylthiotransferase
MNVGIVSLGCAKNQVDLEEILAYLKANGFETVSDPALADMILINTCGFIDAAKKESIDAILEMIPYGKPVIVTGCLATRYLDELKKEIPEVALWIPLSDYPKFGEKLQTLLTDKKFSGAIDPTKRVFISPSGKPIFGFPMAATTSALSAPSLIFAAASLPSPLPPLRPRLRIWRRKASVH